MKNPSLLQDAIIQARELKEAAEKSVKQQLMEELSPLIKKTLETQFSSVLKEQDSQFSIEEEPGNLDTGLDAGGLSADTSNLPVNTGSNSIEVTDTVTGEEPTKTDPASDNHTVNIPLPDANGEITVSITDLFTKPSEVIQAVDSLAAQEPAPIIAPAVEETPAEEPPAAAAQELTPPSNNEIPLMENVRSKFLNLLETLTEGAGLVEKLTPSIANNIQLGFIALAEEGQDLLEKGLIESRDLVLCKKRAEKIQNSLQEKLNTGSEQNSYNEESNKNTHGENMAIKKTLKDLFEETEIAFDGLDTNKPVKDAESKQNKIDGQDPGQNPGDADADGKSKEGEWDKEGAAGAASDSASQKTALEEAIELFKAAMRLDENDEGSVVDGEGEGEGSSFGGSSEGESAEGAGEGEFDIEALLKDFEQQLQDHGVSLDTLNVDVGGEKNGEEFELSFDLDDEGNVEPASASADAGAGPAGDDEGAIVIAEATQAIKKAKATIAESRREKQELEVYLHKTTCLNKLLMRESISTMDEKKEAVTALDRGNTIEEVTEIYNRIVAHKLQEGKAARSGKATAGTENGTISESVKREGAKPLNEGADPFVERLQSLAKMK